MRRITEFKGYQSTIEYDPQTGAFVTVKVPVPGEEMTLDETLVALERVIPFPDLGSDAMVESPRTRKVG